MDLFDAIQIRNKKDSKEKVKAFVELLQEVELHDKKAAKYLLELALSHTVKKQDINFGLTRRLDGCLLWDNTKQGRDYWFELYKKICENE